MNSEGLFTIEDFNSNVKTPLWDITDVTTNSNKWEVMCSGKQHYENNLWELTKKRLNCWFHYPL